MVPRDPASAGQFRRHGRNHGLAAFYRHQPGRGWLGNFLADTRAEGNAQTDIRLDMPLKDTHATRVNGAVTLAGGDISLLPDVPPFYSAAARIEFTESNFRIANATRRFSRWPGEPRGGMRRTARS